MTVFWAIALVAGLMVAAALSRPLLRTRAGDGAAEAPDIAVYRDQLSEAGRDIERGVLSEAEAAAIRTELSRRLLAAADGAAPATDIGPRGVGRTVAALMLLAVLGGGVGLYAALGAPGVPDQPLAGRLAQFEERRANRPSQDEAEAFLSAQPDVPAVAPPDAAQMALIGQLRDILRERPDDLRGHQLLARNLGRLGQYADAYAAQTEVLRILGDEASGEDHADLAEYLILAVNGYISPRAEAALTAALERDPREPRARYYAGLAAVQAGRPDLAYNLWTSLLADSRPDAPWVAAINSQIADVAAAAGRTLPGPPPRGPTAADIEAAQDLSPEDRQNLVRAMVAGLAERLANDGGPAEDWARLVRAYGVLGETDKARAIWQEARTKFAAEETAMPVLLEAARAAGVAE